PLPAGRLASHGARAAAGGAAQAGGQLLRGDLCVRYADRGEVPALGGPVRPRGNAGAQRHQALRRLVAPSTELRADLRHDRCGAVVDVRSRKPQEYVTHCHQAVLSPVSSTRRSRCVSPSYSPTPAASISGRETGPALSESGTPLRGNIVTHPRASPLLRQTTLLTPDEFNVSAGSRHPQGCET